MAKKKTKKVIKKKPVEKKPDIKIDEAKQKITPYPQAAKKVEEFEMKLDQQIENSPARRKRGRPKKEDLPKPEFAMNEQIIQQAIKMPFDLWSVNQKLEQLKLLDEEAAALAAPVKQLLDHYLPNTPMIAIAWASLSVTVYSVMVIRLTVIAAIKKSKNSSPSSEKVDPDSKEMDRNSGSPIKIEFPEVQKPIKL